LKRSFEEYFVIIKKVMMIGSVDNEIKFKIRSLLPKIALENNIKKILLAINLIWSFLIDKTRKSKNRTEMIT